MTQPAHTPGPWYVDSCDDDLVFSANGLHIATVGNEHQPDQSAEEITANARLIAAAPDLLAAAEKVIASWQSGDLAAAVRQLDAAIDLAKGDAA